MAISFVASTNGTFVGVTSFTVTKPAGVVDGDVCILFACASDDIASMSNASWTQLFQVDETGLDSGSWVARRVISGDGASWSITSGGTETGAWCCLAFRGVDNTTPIGASTSASGASSATQVCGPITVTSPGAWIVCSSENDVSTPGGTYSGPGGNFVMQENVMESTLFVMLGAGYEDMQGVTGSTSRTLTSSFGADVFVSTALELLPAASLGAVPYVARPLLPRLRMFSKIGTPFLGFPQIPSSVPSAATIAQPMTATSVVVTASMQKQVGKQVTATAVGVTASMLKSVGKLMTATSVAVTASMLKQVGKLLTATAVGVTASMAMVKVKLLTMTATAVVVTASMVKQVNKPLTATAVVVTGSIVKQVNKILTATSVVVTASLATIKVKLLAMTATAVVVTATMTRSVGKALTATSVAVSASLTKQVNKTLTATAVAVTASLSTIKVKLVAMTATAVVVTATMRRQVNTTLSATVAVSATMTKQIAKRLSATVVVTASLVANAIIAGAVQIVSYFRSSPSEPGYTDTPGGASSSAPDESEFGSGPSGSTGSNPTEGRFDS